MLPTKKTPQKKALEDQTILIYGHAGIGKTTIASKFNNPLFLATEAGLNSVEVYQEPVPTWEHFLKVCAAIGAGSHEFKTVVIDTIDNLYKCCSEFIRKKHNIAHESDLEWGKGWTLVSDEFTRALTKLSLLPYGLVMISHVEITEIKTRTAVISKAMPTVPNSARKIIIPMADIILYCDSVITGNDGERRVMRTQPSENYEGKDRTGRLPAVLPLSYKAFFEAFTGNKGSIGNGNGSNGDTANKTEGGKNNGS